MKTTALARIAAGLLVCVLFPLSPVQAKEDGKRCKCWHAGYSAFTGGGFTEPEKRRASCKTMPPDSSLDECDINATQKQSWMDGCLAHAENEPDKCPYKSSET